MKRQLSLLAGSGAAFPSLMVARNEPQSCAPPPRADVGQALRRARSSDPATSHQAAEGVPAFAGSHYERIVRGLQAVANATPHELTKATGLTVVQIDRRLPELERQGRARVMRDAAGEIVQRGAARVWEVVR